MKSHLDVKRVTLTLCSPVHIGTRVRQYSPLEAVATGGWVYKVHEERLALALQEQRLLEEFVLCIGREAERFDLGAYLESKRLRDPAFLARIAEFRTKAAPGISTTLLPSFRPAVRGGLGLPYIPGSSIKGAIRTGLLHHRIEHMGEAKEQIVQGVAEQIDRGVRRERLGERVVGPLLQGRLDLGRRRPDQVTPQHREVLRCLKVSDATWAGETVLLPVKVLSLRQGDNEFYLKEQVLLECIPAGARLACSLTLDQALLSEFQGELPFRSLGEVLEQVGAFGAKVLDGEYRFFDGLRGAEALDDFYNQTDANLRLGLGSGLPASTIHLTLPEAIRLRVRDEVFRMHRHSKFFPKSRKVVVERDRPVMSLGWVRLEVE